MIGLPVLRGVSGTGRASPVPLLVSLTALLVVLVYWSGIENLLFRWSQREEYSHGFFIPLISLWLLWRRRDAIAGSAGRGSLSGVLLVLAAVVLLGVGELSALYLLVHLSLVLCLTGTCLALGGWSLLRVCLLPLAYLVFAIPMPYFIDAQLSWWLQLVSSALGVEMLRAFGVVVHLQGNVIDLGHYALQVVEACSGLRYLYPLSSLGFLAAYLSAAPLWQRALVFASVVPITVIMNSVRIAVIGALVKLSGVGAADGFLHFFEGWVIFMACAMILLLEIWCLDRLGRGRPPGQLLAVPEVRAVAPAHRGFTALPILLSCLLLLAGKAWIVMAEQSGGGPPERLSFSSFPLAIGPWRGQEDYLDQGVQQSLGLDDYLLADYRRAPGEVVNLYVAYYARQEKGVSPHSPRVCIPGGGWSITDFSRGVVRDHAGADLPVNRAELELNSRRQLVYYWFDQRGRRIANEYLVKWHLFRDSLQLKRTDGALVRVSTMIGPEESVEQADRRIIEFIRAGTPVLPDYLPH